MSIKVAVSKSYRMNGTGQVVNNLTYENQQRFGWVNS